MLWTEVKKQYPHQWVLVEALDAQTKENQRLINQLMVLNAFSKVTEAMDTYQRLHRLEPAREYYVLHTDKQKLKIPEQRWMGIRFSCEA